MPPAWEPSVDIYRGRHGWLFKIDIAGVREGDVNVDIRGHVVKIHGIRRDAGIHDGWRHYVLEISYSRFQRVFEMPESLEGARVQSEYCDGMLWVRILK